MGWNTRGNYGGSDYHFLMTGENAHTFQSIYFDFQWLHLCKPHSGWVQEFLSKHDLVTNEDSIIAGEDEEIYRKVTIATDTFPEKREHWKSFLAEFLPKECLQEM